MFCGYIAILRSKFLGSALLPRAVRLRLFFPKIDKTIYVKNATRKAITYGGGALVGAISGFFGGGGGMLCVPLLEFSGLDVKRAHATALLVILPICIVSTVVYVMNGYFDYAAVMCAMIGVSFGGAAGAALLDKLGGTVVGLIFAALMIAIGVKLLIP